MSQPNPLAYTVEEFLDDNYHSLVNTYWETAGADRLLLDDPLSDISSDDKFLAWVEEQFDKQMEAANAD